MRRRIDLELFGSHVFGLFGEIVINVSFRNGGGNLEDRLEEIQLIS